MRFDFSPIMTLRAALGAILLAFMALCITLIWIEWSAPALASGDVLAEMTVIAAPSGTPLPPPTPTFDPNAPTPTPTLAPGQIAIGSYVQITGTEGLGLRIRSAPGLNGESLFLGYDAEVFVVDGGPRQADGYSWYSLVAPYDATRTGWAASDYLTIIPAPQN